MPCLQKSFEQEAARAGGWVQHVVCRADVKKGDGEPRELTHREILAELSSKDRAEELLERSSDGIDVCSVERDVLQYANHLLYLGVGQAYAGSGREHGRVSPHGLGEQ